MSALQKIVTQYINSAGQTARAGAVAVVNKGGNKSGVTIVRPANTTDYSAGDAIGIADTGTPANAGSAILTFPLMGSPGGFIRINSADLRIDLAGIPSGMAAFILHLYDDVPDAIFDNAAWDLASTLDRNKYLGSITLNPVDVGSTLFAQTDNIGKQVKLNDGQASLYGVLTTAGAYAPTSGCVYRVTLNTAEL